MKTCATCRYWAPPGERPQTRWDDEKEEDVPLPQRRCLEILHGNGSSYDEGDGKTRSARTDTPAYVADGSGYAATLYTLGSFGCLLHEARP